MHVSQITLPQMLVSSLCHRCRAHWQPTPMATGGLVWCMPAGSRTHRVHAHCTRCLDKQHEQLDEQLVQCAAVIQNKISTKMQGPAAKAAAADEQRARNLCAMDAAEQLLSGCIGKGL